MSKRNTMPDYDPVPSQRGGASKPSKKKKKKLVVEVIFLRPRTVNMTDK